MKSNVPFLSLPGSDGSGTRFFYKLHGPFGLSFSGFGRPLCFGLIFLLGLFSFCGGFAQSKKVGVRTGAGSAIGSGSGSGSAAGSGLVEVTSVEGITEYRLVSNGLRVLLFPDDSKPTATVNMTYLVGSRNENYGETGMAHLLEHLMFKGSPKHPHVPAEFSTYGANWNGSTFLDRTNYFETFPSNEKSIAWALDLEAERMVHSFIAKSDLNSEMTVVRNEFESGENSPTNILSERMQSTAFLWHNYGNSTIGARSDIEQVPINRLQGFYRNYYQPDNAVLTVAGKFDIAQVKKLIALDFGKIPKPSRVLQETYTTEPTQDGERSVVLRRTGDVQAVGALYHIPNGFHPDYEAVNILNDILLDEPSGRLYKNLVEKKLASNVFGYSLATKEPGFMVYLATVLKEKSLDSAKAVFLSTLEDFIKTPPTTEEVERMKTKELKNIEIQLNSSDQIGIALSEFISQGDWRLLFWSRDEIKKVTKEDVLRVAGQYLKPSNRTLGEFYPTAKPERSEIPTPPVLADVLKDFKGGKRVVSGETFDPSPSNIMARTQISKVGGVKMALLPKKTRGGAVNMNFTIYFGNPATTSGKGTIGNLMVSMLDKGTANRTRQQIQDAFDKLKAQVQIFGNAASITVHVETIHEKLSGVLDILAEIVKAPSFPADELEKLKNQNLAGLEQGRSEPQAIAVRLLRSKINPYPAESYRHIGTLDEDIAAIKSVQVSDIQTYYKNNVGGSKINLSVVGEFSADSIKNQISTLFSNWNSPVAYERVPDPLYKVSATNDKILTPDKANAMYFAGSTFPLKDTEPDYAALKIASYIFGEAQLSNRLANRIRQKEGISYGVGAFLNSSDIDPKSTFLEYAIYAPQNLEKLEIAFREETQKALADGFTQAELDEAKKGFLNGLIVELSTDNQLAGTLAGNLYIDRTMDFTQKLEEQVKALSLEQVNAAFRKYISLDNISVVKAGDFDKKVAPAPPAK